MLFAWFQLTHITIQNLWLNWRYDWKKHWCILHITMHEYRSVSGYRCVSDCRSRGLKFDPGQVPYFREDHEIISMVILLPSVDTFKKGCCQLQAKVCAQSTGHYPLVQACPGKSVVRWTHRPTMSIAVDLGLKVTKQTKQCMNWVCDSK